MTWIPYIRSALKKFIAKIVPFALEPNDRRVLIKKDVKFETNFSPKKGFQLAEFTWKFF